MSLRAAVQALKRTLGPYTQVALCSVCGSPPKPGYISCILLPGQVPAHCPACNHPVDPSGRAIGAPTPSGIHTVYIHTDDVEPPYDA